MARETARERLKGRGQRLVETASAPAARTTIGVAAFATVAFSVIQGLQSQLGELNPRPWVAIFFGVAIASLGAALASFGKVWGERKAKEAEHAQRSRRLAASIGKWPCADIGRLNPIALGVFPPDPALTAEGVGLPPYVERPELDQAIRSGLEHGGLLLLVGPERVGKTRSAYEAVRGLAPGDALVVPVSGRALEAVAAEEPGELESGLLWLDDFDRFLDYLEEPYLTHLLQGGWWAVATIREDALAAMLEGSGERAAKAKRVFAAATVVRVPRELVEPEACEAAERDYPGRDAASFGSAVAATTREAPAAAFGGSGVHALSGGAPPRVLEPVEHGPNMIGWIAAAVALVFALLCVFAAREGPFEDSVSEVVQDIRHAHSKGDGRVVAAVSEKLRGPDSDPSHVFVFARGEGKSDKLAIYDERSQALDRTPELDIRARAGRRAVGFSALGVGEGFQDGTRPLIGAFEVRSSDKPDVTAAQVPVAIRWDDGAERYDVFPLVPPDPPARVAGTDSRGLVTLVNEAGKGPKRITGAAVSTFLTAGVNELLITGSLHDLYSVDVVFYTLDFSSGEGVQARLVCDAGGGTTFNVEGAARPDTLERALDQHGSDLVLSGDACHAVGNSGGGPGRG
jgi:hypothetical protein